MTDPQRFWRSLPVIPQRIIDLLLGQGIDPLAIGLGANPPLKIATGECAADGWFEPDEHGRPCIAVPIDDGDGVIDVGFWDARTGATARLLKFGFALGEDNIDNPGAYRASGAT